jgi:hypothetical protein
MYPGGVKEEIQVVAIRAFIRAGDAQAIAFLPSFAMILMFRN